MSGFVFPLQALLNYRRNRRDLCRQVLAQILSDDLSLMNEREKLVAARERQFDEIRDLSRRGSVGVGGAAMRRYHSIQLLANVHSIDGRRQLLAQQLQFCREALAKADGEVKLLERLEEKQRAEFLYVAERRAQHEREDAWAARRVVEETR